MIYLFNNNEEMIRIVPNSAIKRMYQTQKLTDENYISDRLDVEIQALNDEELSELEYMAIDDIENPQRFHYYFIAKETTEHQVTSLTGVQSGIEELRKTPVYDMRPTNLSPKLIADRLLEGTNWQAGYTTDDVGTISTNFYYTDVFSALKKMCMAFGIEMQFFVEITTNRIGARYIEFRKRTGKSVGKRVVYGHNALKIVKEVEKTNTVTALIGRGKGVQVSESDAGNIGYGRKIGFENVEWKTSSGAPVDKPLGQEFVEIPELTLQYGIKNSNGTVRPKIGFVEFQDEESETRLIDRTYNVLLELSRPQVLLETSSVYLPDTGIGDTINVVRHDRDLRYQTRVFEITWDRLANQAVDMKLGDRLGESESKRISRISNQVSGNISTELGSTIDELIDRLPTADKKNTNWYTDYDPMGNPDTMGLVRVNDNWWQPDPEFEGEFILKQWNGEMWVEILRTSGNPELVRRIDEAMAEAEQALVDAEQALADAEQALADAGISNNLAQTAKDLATTAKANAQTAINNAQSALTEAGDAKTTADSLSVKVDDLEGEVELKATQIEVDGISGRVSTAESNISQNATAISARLTSTEVNSLVDGKGFATQTWANNQITATANGIEQLITEVKTDPTGTIAGYNSLKNNVDSMVQAIGSDGGKIAQMVMTDSVFQTNVMTDGNLVQNGSFANGSAFGWEPYIGLLNRAEDRVDGWYASLSRRDLYSTYDVSVVSGETLYVSIKAWGDDNQPLRFGMLFFDKNNGHIDWRSAFNPTTNNTPTDYTGTIKVPDKAAYGRVWVNIDRWDNYGTLWFTNAKITRSATQSQITQLQDNINLKVSEGDLINQININAGGTLIQSGTNRLNITPTTTYIEDATIKSAHIDSLDANKITTGELNAANVRIVNLDVNSLSGNAMNFISGAFTSNAGSLLLSGNGIRVNFSNGYNLRINGSGTNYYTRAGQVVGGLLTAIPGAGVTTHSLSLVARRGYTVSMDYQGSLGSDQSYQALSVHGTTGNITVHRPIYESSGSAGLEFTRAQMENVGWGLLLASTKATGTGIFLADNGGVWIGISGGYKQFA